MSLLTNRAAVYERARRASPQRWSKQTRDWSYIDQVNLNPETPKFKEPGAYKEAS